MSKFEEMDLKDVRRIPFAERETKVDAEMFGKTALDDDSFAGFFRGLPDILVAKDLKALARQTAEIIAAGRKVIVMMGAHLIKIGVSPLFVELIRRKAVSCLVLNGAGVIHDFEVAMFGRTSEDVAANLETGAFGYVEETGVLINQAVSEGAAKGLGYGEAVAEKLAALPAEYPELSLLLAAREHGIPVTVHVAIGTETIHQHPECDGAAIGEMAKRRGGAEGSNCSAHGLDQGNNNRSEIGIDRRPLTPPVRGGSCPLCDTQQPSSDLGDSSRWNHGTL